MALNLSPSTLCVGAVCSVVCWQPAERRSEFSKLDNDADIGHIDNTDVSTDDGQRDVTESSTDDESNVDIQRQ